MAVDGPFPGPRPREPGRRRALLLGIALLVAYASTLGLHAFGASDYGGDEPHYLLAATSLVEDGDLDVLDEYRSRAYSAFYPYELEPHGVARGGRLLESHGPGFPLLIAPAVALGGPWGAELLMALLMALTGTLSYLLARRAVPDPWALGASLGVALSPPLVAYGTALAPEAPAAAALAGAALLALDLAERPSRAGALGCFAALAVLPWLGPTFLPAGVVIGVMAWRGLTRARRLLLRFVGLEVVALSYILFVAVSAAMYGGSIPYATLTSGDPAAAPSSVLDHLVRSYRLVALLIDREYGLLRWAPIFGLVFVALWLLWRTRTEGLSRVVSSHREAERVAGLCAAALGAQLLAAAFLAPMALGAWFPGRHLLAALPLAVPLVAWGARRLPRVALVLGAIGLAASTWLVVAVRLDHGGLAAARPNAPWGPLEVVFPLFAASPAPYVLAGALGAAVLIVVAVEVWRARRVPTSR